MDDDVVLLVAPEREPATRRARRCPRSIRQSVPWAETKSGRRPTASPSGVRKPRAIVLPRLHADDGTALLRRVERRRRAPRRARSAGRARARRPRRESRPGRGSPRPAPSRRRRRRGRAARARAGRTSVARPRIVPVVDTRTRNRALPRQPVALGRDPARVPVRPATPFADWLEERRLALDDVDARVLADYTAELGRGRPRKLAPATIARRLAAVRSLLRFTLGAAPGARGDRRPAPPAPPAGRAEGRRGRRPARGARRATARSRCATARCVELVYSAGLRSREAVDLDLADVDFEQELVHVPRQGREGARRPARRGGGATGSRATCARRGPSSPAAPRTRSSSRRAAAGSTRARSAGSSPTPTASATPSRRTCSRAAPTCA